MTQTIQTGRCACGAVTFSALAPKTYGACHCETCRRWTGGVWMGGIPEQKPDVQGDVTIWKSSRYAERGFCAACGTSIWHRAKGAKVPTLGQGLFNDQTGWQRSREIFVDEMPDHYAFGAPAKAFTGMGAIIGYVLGRLPK